MTIEDLYRVFQESNGACTDSRTVIPGSVYFALKGEKYDGNDFALEAISKGCKLAVSDRATLNGRKGILVVASALRTLQDLAAFHRRQQKTRILAITGSNGKTTTKELIAAVLQKEYRVLYTKGNLNNHIGVPLTLLELDDEEYGIIELGANHHGEIAALARITAPDFGLITNIGKAHLEGFGSLQGVLEAKSELYQFLVEHHGEAFLNMADSMLLDKARALNLSILPYNCESLNGKVMEPYPELKCGLSYKGQQHTLRTHLVGTYNLENILSAVAVGLHFGIPMGDILSAIGSYQPEMKRSQLIKGERNTLILDAYNANPSSMRESVSDFLSYADGPRMLILGDMLELGKEEEMEHQDLLRWLNDQAFDQALIVGEAFDRAGKALSKAGQAFEGSGKGFDRFAFFPETQACISFLKKNTPSGYHVLIKGSRKIALESVTIHLNN